MKRNHQRRIVSSMRERMKSLLVSLEQLAKISGVCRTTLYMAREGNAVKKCTAQWIEGAFEKLSRSDSASRAQRGM